MQAQLQGIVEGFERAREHLRRLAEHDEARWAERPEPGRWSAAECVAHLNLTSEAYLPVIDGGLARAERLPTGASVRYRLDPVGWLLLASMAPWLRMRVRTSAPFVPAAQVGRDADRAQTAPVSEAIDTRRCVSALSTAAKTMARLRMLSLATVSGVRPTRTASR